MPEATAFFYSLCEKCGLGPFRCKKLEFVQRARPVFAEKARQSAIRQKLSAGLARGAIVGFVRRVPDALYFRAAARARLFVTAVHSHAFPERRHVFGELSGRFCTKPFSPARKGCACGLEEPLNLWRRDFLCLRQR